MADKGLVLDIPRRDTFYYMLAPMVVGFFEYTFMRVLDETEKLGLVHNCDNVMNKPAYMCHCCGCCCVILTGIKETAREKGKI